MEDAENRRSAKDEIRPTCSVPPHQLEHSVLSADEVEQTEGLRCLKSRALTPPGPEADVSMRRRTLVRSRTLDPTLLLQVQSDGELKCDHRKLLSTPMPRANAQYHKVFKEISNDEQLRQSYTCALQKDILYQGRIFLSQNWICFHSRVFGKDTKIAIPVSSVTAIKKTNTAILVPNALVISTAHERHVFVSFLSRDTTYKVLMSLCSQLMQEGPGVGQAVSARGRTPLSDHHTDDSSSSESPESLQFKKSQKFTKRSSDFSQTPALDSLQQKAPVVSGSRWISCSASVPPAGSSEFLKEQRRSPLSASSVNLLLLFCAIMVCVLLLCSCYVLVKVVSLEQRLASLVSVEFPPERDQRVSVISSGLLKIQQIHRELQQMLTDTEDR